MQIEQETGGKNEVFAVVASRSYALGLKKNDQEKIICFRSHLPCPLQSSDRNTAECTMDLVLNCTELEDDDTTKEDAANCTPATAVS